MAEPILEFRFPGGGSKFLDEAVELFKSSYAVSIVNGPYAVDVALADTRHGEAYDRTVQISPTNKGRIEALIPVIGSPKSLLGAFNDSFHGRAMELFLGNIRYILYLGPFSQQNTARSEDSTLDLVA